MIRRRKKIVIPHDVIRKMDKLQECVSAVVLDPKDGSLEFLRRCLNETFKGTHCRSVIYTNNTDKLFFGMCVMPIISSAMAKTIILDGEVPDGMRKEYVVEIDSKLFEIGLTEREVMAILLHEIGHIVLDMDQSLEEIIDATQVYISKNNEVLNTVQVANSGSLFKFGIEDALRKMGTIFSNDEKKADAVAAQLGYGVDLESAFTKISRRSLDLNRDVDNKLIVLQWALRTYKNLNIDRKFAIRKLNNLIDINGSEVENSRVKTMLDDINNIDSKLTKPLGLKQNIEECCALNEKGLLSIYRRHTDKAMRGIEEDLYELQLMAKATDDRDECLMILRQINSRLSILEDYLSGDKISDSNRKRYSAVMNEYLKLRAEVGKKNTVPDEFLSLWVKTPMVKSRYEF